MTLLILGQLATLLLLALTAYSVGRWVTISLPFESGVEEFAFRCAIGLGLCGTSLFLLGLAHLLAPAVIVGAILLIHLLSARSWIDSGRRLFASFRVRRAHRLTWSIFALAAALPFVLSLYPPNVYDETCYHLPVAKLFAQQHRVVFDETLRFPLFPQLSESLFSAILSLASDTRTHVVELLATILTALLAGSAIEKRSQSVALLAAAFWLGNPLVSFYAGSSMVDLLLTLFCTTSLLAWMRWRSSGELTWLSVAAMSAGFAAGTKYPGLYFIAALAVLTFFFSLRKEARGSWRAVTLFLLLSGALACPPYLRNLAVSGNPTFPFFGSFFGRNEWPASLEHGAGNAGAVGPITRVAPNVIPRPGDFLLRPWRVVADREHLAGQPPVSAMLLVAIPFIAFAFFRLPALRQVGALALLYAYLVTYRDVRFLLPVLPLFCAAAAFGLASAIGRLKREKLTFTVALLLLIAPALLYDAIKIGQRGRVPASPAERDLFLASQIESYPALQFLNRKYGTHYSVYVAAASKAHYYAEGRFLGDVIGPYRYGKLREANTALELERVVRSMGATHLIVHRFFPRYQAPSRQELSRVFKFVLRYGEVELYELSTG